MVYASKANESIISGVDELNYKKTELLKKDFIKHYGGIKWTPDFIKDISPQILLMGGRRGGKTTSVAAKIAYTDLYFKPEIIDSFIFYSSKTFEHAKSLMWGKLKSIKDFFNIDDWNMNNESDAIIRTPRCKIKLLGFNDVDAIGKALGQPFKLFVIDEAQEIRSDILQTVIRDAAAWGSMDAGGTVVLCGNPSRFKYHFWSQEWLKDLSKKYTTNLFENPFMDEKAKIVWLKKQREIRGEKEGEETPEFRRMAYGDLIFESTNSVFHISDNNYYEEAPEDLEKVIGVDLGWRHNDAVVVLGWKRASKKELGKIYLLEEHQTKTQSLESLAKMVDDLAEKHSVYTIVMDTGGLVIKNIPDLNLRYSKRRWVPATKTEKIAWVKLLQTEILSGRFLMKKDSQFERDASLVEWDEKVDKLDEKAIHSDILDAVLYASRYCHTNLINREEDNIVNLNSWSDFKRNLAFPKTNLDDGWAVPQSDEW